MLDWCAQWRAQSQGEGEGIAAADWEKVARCQAAKRDIQPRMEASKEELRQQAAREGVEVQDWLRGVAAEMIALEEENRSRLHNQQQVIFKQGETLHRAGRNLGRMRRAYASSEPSLWQSYS